VGAGVPQLYHLVKSTPEDLALPDPDGPERPSARIITVTPRQLHGHPQVPSVVIIKFSGHGSQLPNHDSNIGRNLRYPGEALLSA
jgi:hypothetical protein